MEGVFNQGGDVGWVKVVPAVVAVFVDEDGHSGVVWFRGLDVRLMCGEENSVLFELDKRGSFVLVGGSGGVAGEDGDLLGVTFVGDAGKGLGNGGVVPSDEKGDVLGGRTGKGSSEVVAVCEDYSGGSVGDVFERCDRQGLVGGVDKG